MTTLTQWNFNLTGIFATPSGGDFDTYGFDPILDVPDGYTLLRSRMSVQHTCVLQQVAAGAVPWDQAFYGGIEVEVGLYLTQGSGSAEAPPHVNDSPTPSPGWIMRCGLHPENDMITSLGAHAQQTVKFSANADVIQDSHAQRGPVTGGFGRLNFAWHYSDPESFFSHSGTDFNSFLTGYAYVETLWRIPS